jgi:2-isopropylmalate synthase
VILNLPATVEAAPPNVHADQIEWFIRNVRNRDRVIISVHTHNDRGCAVAAAELAQLAGARRVEGTLFGNGERTGNVDLITLALNLYSQGIDPGVDIRDINEIARIYRDCTGMSIHPRHPYAGELVYTAFSGSHQDAISKGLAACRGAHTWRTPYLPIDPEDIGRGYEAVVRINSQSGKGGAAYVLERTYGYRLPRTMHPDFGAAVQRRADESGTELTARELLACFEQEYLDTSGPLSLEAIQYAECVRDECRSEVSATLVHAETRKQVNGKGNGALDALTHGLRDAGYALEIVSYDEHSLGSGSDARAVAYIHITSSTGSAFGAGRDTDIAAASAKALISALNRAIAQGERCGRASVRSDSPVAARGDRSPA